MTALTQFKVLRIKGNTDEWIVFNSDIPEGYGFSMTPQLLGNETAFEDLHHLFPTIDMSEWELVTIDLFIHS